MNPFFHKTSCLIFLLAIPASTGCTPSLPPVADPQQARAALKMALDTWQRGEAPQTLLERMPPIQFADLHWQKGERLVKYEVAGAEPRGLSLRLTVKLSLEGKNGQRRQATTVYLADVEPRIVIVPEF